LHGPVLVNACESCHKLTDAGKHSFEPMRTRDQMCVLCHVVDVAPQAPGTAIHKPFAEGECLSCHDPHGSREKAMLRGDRYADACKTCHADITGAHDRVHGPASAGACGACHKPHTSSVPKLLIAEGRELCLRCHVKTGLDIESKRVVHPPAKGDCRICHDPHATDFPGMLTADAVTLCTGCHADIGNTIDTATTQHAAVTTKRSCLNCHAAHASDYSSLLKSEEKSLCFECHNQAIELPDGTKLANMKEVIEKGKSLHGAIADRNCDVCHEIHGGGHRRLLTNEYPSDLYYPFSESAYALCFSCHDRQMVLLSRSENVTAFRNGDRNLHYAHVNRDGKGRSCRVCHDAHASSHDQHIRAEIPYGPAGWKLPIKYEQLPEGGRCGPGCHTGFEYNRTKPIVYPAGAAEGAWKGEELVPGIRAEPPSPPPDKKPGK
jgi:predicted CXXCH cytochrome family protein